ncbi:hypothetical protein OH76DRAFT_357559 [Lentinus brumalis]|uniref:Uncharacterized protein n=1 Tax=Lentinus brumalis TaxID=2498619 RepID=A0A371DF72_9APHY|nr:hypothetical protein OH76DRAFT_357559 [Polyporus brumalis]
MVAVMWECTYTPAVSQLQDMHYWKKDPHLTFPRPHMSVPPTKCRGYSRVHRSDSDGGMPPYRPPHRPIASYVPVAY